MEFDIRARNEMSPLTAIGIRYGDQLAQGIVRAGAQIEDGLKQVTTTRQLQGLGQVLSQIDPKTPDYTQKLLEIAPNFPFAMQDPLGQTLMSIGVKDHFQWQQTEAAKARLNTNFQNQKALVNYRAANRPAPAGGEVDLSGMFGAPAAPQNPASGINFGTDETQVTTPPETTGNRVGAAANIDAEGSLLPPVAFQAGAKPAIGGIAVPPRLGRQTPASGIDMRSPEATPGTQGPLVPTAETDGLPPLPDTSPAPSAPADNAPALMIWRELTELLPDATLIYIRRSPSESQSSLARIAGVEPALLRTRYAALVRCAKELCEHSEPCRLEFSDLTQEHWLRTLWGWVAGHEPLPDEHLRKMMSLHVRQRDELIHSAARNAEMEGAIKW